LDSLELNWKVAEVKMVGLDGPEVIVVSGGVVSGVLIAQLYEAGVRSVLPAISFALTWKV
jgi:hypothetical protein